VVELVAWGLIAGILVAVALGIVAEAQAFDMRGAGVIATPETWATWVMWAASEIDIGIYHLHVSCVHN
jgi:hypothetical protein